MRAATEPGFHGPGYAQNTWADIHAYQEMPWNTIVDFRHQYNTFLAGLIGQLPADKMNTLCHIGNSPAVTLEYVIQDYLKHLQHHVDHLLQRAVIHTYGAT